MDQMLAHFIFSLVVSSWIRPSHSWFFPSDVSIARPSVPKSVRLLILPGFGNESNDYYLEQAPQGSLVNSLKSRGWTDDQISVLPMQRSDWLKVFLNGAVDLQFWLSKADPTRPSFSWYLKRVADCIDEMTATEDTFVVIIGHSAGGWLARAALGFGSDSSKEDLEGFISIDLNRVLGMVTLGAPHLPPPPEIMDMTRGALRITNDRFPGAFHQQDGLFYITAIGDAVAGVKQERKNPFEPTSPSDFAFNSYEAVCGKGDTVGDGVVPLSAGHLDEAIQLNLEGIFHSINVPDRWYGSEGVIDSWHTDMLSQIAKRARKTSSKEPLSIIFDSFQR